jgi:subtilisin family serine protease
MKKFLSFLLFAGFALVAAQPLGAQSARPARARLTAAQQQQHVQKGVIRVKLAEKPAARLEAQIEKQPVAARRLGLQSSAAGKLNTGTSKLNRKLQSVKAQKMRRLFPYHPRYEARQREAGLHLWYEVEIDTTVSPVNACAGLIDGDIIAAEPVLKKVNIEVLGKKQPAKPEKALPLNERILPVSVVTRNRTPMNLTNKAQATPFAAAARHYEDNPPVNDPYLLHQWHYYNYGQIVEQSMGGASDPNASIHLFDAWKITMGDPRVIVSIHDHGVDYNHPDLLDNMWVNQKEYRGEPGIDDDGNGFIDDVYGYNFLVRGNIVPASHGTHVAGTIAAVNNNGIGVAGVAGGSGRKDGVRVMSCEILGTAANDDGGAVSYVYAANNGAVISQNSWGYSVPDSYEQVLLDAIDYFIKWAGRDENGDPLPNTPMVGGLVVCAASNNGASEKYYPAAYAPCLSVSATGPWNERPAYTNYGEWVDIAAPGGNTSIGSRQPFSPAGVLSCNLSTAATPYGYMQGTSMACPHVSGVAALVLSAYGNSAYTPEMLQHRLLSSVSTWDELGKPNFNGKMGAGLLNAAKALHPNENKAPDAITDLRVEAESYDYVTLRFTAPADSDNRDAHLYEIRYATEAITAGNIDKAKVLYQPAQSAGTAESVMIDRLQGETTYYITVRAVDIWGNLAGLSNVVMATTKQAPAIGIAPAADTIHIRIADAVNHPEGSASFTVKNRQGGDLRYTHNYAVTKKPVWNDNFKRITNFNPAQEMAAAFGDEGKNRFLAATRFTVTEKDFTLTHLQAGIISRGLASNATEAYYGKNFLIKIYKGGKTPASGELISEFTTSIPARTYYFAYGNDLVFTLGEAYRFTKGDTFWIVIDFPAGYLHPMLMSVGTTGKTSDELFSSDGESWRELNKENVLGLPHSYAFRMFALNDTPALLDSMLSITPKSGVLPAGSGDTITLLARAGKLREGLYKGTIFTESNDPTARITHQPFVLTVDGHHKGLRTEKSLSLGHCVQGFSVKKSIIVHNDSLGVLRIKKVKSSKPQFVVSPAANIVINPGDSAVLEITFNAPKALPVDDQPKDSVGVFLTKITLESNAVTPVYTLMADAVSIERPIAKLDKTEETVALHLTEQKTVSFKLKNAGKYRLDYKVGSDQMNNYDYAGVNPADVRYYAKRNDAPARFTSIASPGADISKQLSGTKRAFVPLKFSFDAYGVKYDTLTLFGSGKIALGRRTEALTGVSVGAVESDSAVIYPIFNGKEILTEFKDSEFGGGGGHVYVQAEADKVIIEYSKVGYTFIEKSGEPASTDYISVQTVLYADGRIEFAYQDYTQSLGEPDVKKELSAMIGMTDNTGEGGLGIYFLSKHFSKPGLFIADARPLNGFTEGAYITEEGGKKDTLFHAEYPPFMKYGEKLLLSIFPNQSMTKDIRPTGGSLLPGEEEEITLTLQVARDMREGDYERLIPIYTNDPLNDTLLFKVKIKYTSKPLPVLDTNRLDFGRVGKEVPEKMKVSLRNMGGKAFKIDSIAGFNKSPFFKIQAGSMTCTPFSSVNFDVTFTPKEEKNYTHQITIHTDAGDFPLTMTGTGTARPVMEVERSNAVWNFAFTLAEETARDTALIVKNTGDAPLEYTIRSNDWIKYRPSDPKAYTRSGYFWADNKSSHGTPFQWIWKDPKPFEPVEMKDILYYSKAFALPWTFEFYGKRYDTCYVNASGMIYFEKNSVQYTMTMNAAVAGNAVIPSKDDGANGFIAPLIGVYDLWHCYYEQVGEGTAAQMVFTWDVAALNGGSGRMLFQAVLSSDGSIKFQYKDVENALWRNYTTIGIENHAGDEGLSIAYMDGDYITNGLAIMIVPSVKKTLAPGASERLPFTIDAVKLWDVGKPYKGTLSLLSNDRLHPDITTQVNLAVKGEVKLEYYVNGKQSRVIDYGEVMRYEYPVTETFIQSKQKYQYNTNVPRYFRNVTIKNTGTKVHALSRVNMLGNFVLRDSISSPGGMGGKSVTLDPGNAYRLPVSFNPTAKDPQNALPAAGSYTGDYVVTRDQCEYIVAEHPTNPCVAAQYTYSENITNFFGKPVRTRYYNTDTLRATAYIRDIPNQTLVSPCAVIDTTFDDYKSAKEFTVKLQNPTLEQAYWRKFYNINDKAPVEDQSELNYTLTAFEITEDEYNRLRGLPPAKAAVAKSAASLGWKKTPEVVGVRTSAAAGTSPTATGNAELFVDSLGYFNYAGVADAYSLSADLNDRLVNYIRFKAGEGGFNLTHISMLMFNLGLRPELGYEAVVRIFLGDKPEDTHKVYESTIHTNLNEGVKGTIYQIMLSLSRAIYVEPGRHVWIAVENGCNTSVMSLAYADYESIKDNFIMEGIGSNTFKDYFYKVMGSKKKEGWGIFAWSDRQSDGNAPWVTLSQNAGVLKPGQSADIAVRLTPERSGVERPNYYARIESKSNDPYPYDRDSVIRSPHYFYSSVLEMNDTENKGRNFNEYRKDPARVLVRIHINQGPQIIAPSPARVAENSDATFLLKLVDEEGDGVKDFSLTYVSKIVEDGDRNVEPQVQLGERTVNGDTVIYRVTVHAAYMATGRYTYELKATDHKDKQTKKKWHVTVDRTYRKPFVVSLPDMEVEINRSVMIDLRKAIIDYNDSPVSYTVSVRRSHVAAMVLTNDVLTLVGVNLGYTDVRVKARNRAGVIDTSFNITVTPLRPVGRLEPVAMTVGENRTIDLDRYFSDPAGQGALSYTVALGNTNVAAAQLNSPTILAINALSAGTAEITVTAESVQHTKLTVPFTVTVIDKAQGSNLVIYPNPVTTALHIVAHTGEPREVEIRIFNSSGALVYRNHHGLITDWLTTQINVSPLPAGLYIVQYLANGKEVAKKRFVK